MEAEICKQTRGCPHLLSAVLLYYLFPPLVYVFQLKGAKHRPLNEQRVWQAHIIKVSKVVGKFCTKKTEQRRLNVCAKSLLESDVDATV